MVVIKVYLPKEATYANDTLDTIKSLIGNKLGGYTVYHADGGWVNESGELIQESVWVIESYHEDVSHARYVGKRIGRLIKRMTNESSVLIAVNTEPIYV